MATKKDKKYIDVVLIDQKSKTAVLEVINIKSNQALGIIKWYPPWRQYCFFPNQTTIWSNGCLSEVIEIIKGLMCARELSKIKLHEKPYPASRYGG